MTAPATPPLTPAEIAELRRLHEEAKAKAQVFVLTFDATERLLLAAEQTQAAEEALVPALMFIADQPCETEAVRDDGKRCPDFHPDHPGEWCTGCVAARALAAWRGSR